jgi:pyridoxamine 5'-phosphate oxidase
MNATASKPIYADLRRDYMQRGLDFADLDADPLRQFTRWFDDAVNSKVIAEPNAMTLSTITPEGHPSARIVLLKGADAAGFVFFSNYNSDKGRDLAANPRAALTFGWIELERQVRIEGTVTKTSRAAVEAYFRMRPRGSRLGAWASHQSEVIPDRDVLVARLAEAEARFPGEDVPPPEEWGGYCVTPERIEFWQGRQNRLHDRFRYRCEGGMWVIERLSP